MGFRENWINFINRAAMGTKKSRTLLTPVGVLIFGVFTAVFVFAAIFFDRLFHFPHLFPEDIILPLSFPVLSLGIFVTAWSAVHFLKVKGTPVPFNPPPKLVTTGPYRYARNPMLTGVFIFMIGLGFYVNSVSLVVLFVPLFILINFWELKHIEEPELMKRLGNEYIEYRRKTPMFLPRIKIKAKLNA
jgi:protein-S-isoprenylcysteine O-methyltransferase Ste14